MKVCRSCLLVWAILMLLVASCIPLADPHQVLFSKSYDRSFPNALDGAAVAGNIYPFINPDKDVTEARFYIDDVTRTGAMHSDAGRAPFDMEGGQNWAANAFDTRQLRDGRHTLTAILTLMPGRNSSATASITTEFAVNNTRTVNQSIYWGVAIDGVPWDMKKLVAFESTVGKAPSIVHFWIPWSDAGQLAPFQTDLFENARSHGSIPMISWLPERISQGVNQPDYRLARIIGGQYDDYLLQWAIAAKNWGNPFLLRFAHEPNGFWFPWGESVNGNQKGEYVKAWKHVVDIFRSVGVSNATWVWCPNIDWSGSGWPTMEELYPGDNYVDWTCIDGYNWGPVQGGFASFNDIFRWSYENVRRIAPNKPMMIGEFGCTEQGGSKAAWISDAFQFEIPHDFPGLRAVVWYNFAAAQDWRVESSQASIDAFKAAIAAPYYSTNTFRDLKISPVPPLK